MRSSLLECVEEVRMGGPFIAANNGCGSWNGRKYALQPSLGCNPGRPCQNLDPTVPGLVRPNLGLANPAQFRLVASSIAPLRRLVNFSPIHRVSSEFLAYSHTSLVLDIVRLIYCLS